MKESSVFRFLLLKLMECAELVTNDARRETFFPVL